MDKDVYTIKDLTVFYFGQDYTSDEYSAMLRLLLTDRTYFKRKDNLFFPNPKEHVETVLKQLEAEQSKKEKNEKAVSFLKDVLAGKTKDIPPNLSYLEDLLIDAAVNKKESAKYKDTMSLLSQAGAASDNAPSEILLKLGVFKEDENILLRYYKVERDFSPEIISFCGCFGDLSLSDLLGYEDLTFLNIYTIDDVHTKDIDDGVSIESIGENYRIGIHIADASAFVETNSILDIEAKKRATSIYLPDENINMLPCIISEDKASLVAGQPRMALSFLSTLDQELNLLDFSIKKTIIKVKARLSYDDSEILLQKDSDLALMSSIADKLLQSRISQGALYTPFPRINVHVKNGALILKKDDPTLPFQILVSEFMVLANRNLGDFFVENNIPAIFRNQETPKEKIPDDINYSDIADLHKIRRYLKKVSLDTKPQGHFGLGIKNYVQVTSPIRRYMDLILQRQIKYFLDNGEAAYSEKELNELLLELDYPRGIAETLEKSSKHYWILKYLENLGRTEQRALVLRTGVKSAQIQLCETLLEAEVTFPSNVSLKAGEYIYVIPEIVWPSDHELKLSFCGKE